MNLQNYRLEPNPNTPGDWFVFGDICDNEGNVIATFGPDGTSIFAWWVKQDVAFQQQYSNQFAVIMAQEIVTGMAE